MFKDHSTDNDNQQSERDKIGTLFSPRSKMYILNIFPSLLHISHVKYFDSTSDLCSRIQYPEFKLGHWFSDLIKHQNPGIVKIQIAGSHPQSF